MTFLSTGLVAALLGVTTHRLEYLVRDRQIRPAKGPTGTFMWMYQDVARVARLLKVKAPSEETFLSFIQACDSKKGGRKCRN